MPETKTSDKTKDKASDKTFVAKVGIITGSLAILCCISPVVLVLLGLMSVSAAIALGNNLFYNYKFYFIGASTLFLIGAFYFKLRKKNQCSISGIKKNLNLFIITVFVAILVYIAWYYFTTWLGNIST